MQQPSSISIFDKISVFVLAAVVGLLPVLFFPFLNIPIEFSKSFIFVVGVAFSFLFWIAARLVDGAFTIPRTPMMFSGGAVLVLGFFSALFSPSLQTSFSGTSFGVGTFVSILALMIAFFLASVHFIDRARISYFYIALFASFILVTFFEILFLFLGPKTLSLGTFFSKTTTLLGGFNDLGVFYGLIAILSLFTLELFKLRGKYRTTLAVSLALALFFLAVVNFLILWIVLGVLSLILFVYVLTIERTKTAQHEHSKQSARFPAVSFCVVVVSLFFILGQSFVGPALGSLFKVSETNIRPSVATTFTVVKDVALHDPVFGTGPNRFDSAWALYKPAGINNSVFWDVSFTSGFGFLPTLLVTLGILGGLAAFLFFIFFVILGARKGFSFGDDPITNYLRVSAFLSALYLWIFVLIYNPGTVLLALAFVFTGIFIGLLSSGKDVRVFSFNFLKDPRHSFFSIFALVVVMIGTITGLYFSVQKTVGTAMYYHGANRAFAKKDESAGIQKVESAARLIGSDTYYRSLTDVYIAKLNEILSKKDVSPDTIKSEFQNMLSLSESAAQKAIAIDSTDHLNWTNLAHVYVAVVPLGVAKAYENADGAYIEASKRNPNSPGILLERARLELAHKNNDAARKHIDEALALKPNYTDAIFLLSQIEVSEGNVGKAITQVEQIALLAPNNSGVFFQLGLLRYNNKDYQGAVSAFARAVTLDTTYYNARYFLGLSYDKLGNSQKAIEQFAYLHTALPDNASVTNALNNLESGKSALDSGEVKETPPEKGKEPPIKEKAK